MAIKVYGTVGSTATFRIIACLYEKDLDFELVPVDMATREHKAPHFLSRNPFGQVPALEDGELKLFESRAITQYISRAYADKGTDLISKDLKRSAIETVWIEVESQKFEPPSMKLIFEILLKARRGQTPDKEVVAEFEGKLEQVLDVYERRLKESKYLAGDSFTLADLHHLPNMHYLMGTKVKRLFDGRPHVSAWATDILSRPAWGKVVSMLPK